MTTMMTTLTDILNRGKYSQAVEILQCGECRVLVVGGTGYCERHDPQLGLPHVERHEKMVIV